MKIISILTDKREKEGIEVQNILSQYGDEIYSRIGYHNIEGQNTGLIIVVFKGEHANNFMEELSKIKNVKVKCMEI